MRDFIIINAQDSVTFMDEVEKKLLDGYFVVTSGQYQEIAIDRSMRDYPATHKTNFWAHLAKESQSMR